MRPILILIVGLVLALGAGTVWWNSQFPRRSDEVVQLDAPKRQVLTRLRTENKFKPNEFPPLGYTGIATPEEGVVARSAVNDVLDEILARNNGPVSAKTVSDLIGLNMKRVDQLETEDRERTVGYMIEIWYILGFKGATGRFAYGAGFKTPQGYAEPLPPGWKSPTEPRPIGP